jgi:hypothetical protein
MNVPDQLHVPVSVRASDMDVLGHFEACSFRASASTTECFLQMVSCNTVQHACAQLSSCEENRVCADTTSILESCWCQQPVNCASRLLDLPRQQWI